MSLGPNGKLRVEPERESDRRRLETVMGPGPGGNLESPLLFLFEMDPPKREMSRFLAKIALETVAETFSSEAMGTEELVDSPFFDNVRNHARFGTNYQEWPYSQRRIYPEETLMRHPDTNEWVQAGFGFCWFMNQYRETLCAFVFYGTEFVINVGGPSIKGYEEWLQLHNNISPMVERLGGRLVTEEASAIRHYLEGSMSSKAGLEFDRTHGYARVTKLDDQSSSSCKISWTFPYSPSGYQIGVIWQAASRWSITCLAFGSAGHSKTA